MRLPGVDLWGPGAKADPRTLQVQQGPTLGLLVPVYLLPMTGRLYTAVIITGQLEFGQGRPTSFKAHLPVQAGR
ncbi:hypothetical protein ACFO0D_05925 [Deinococcus hohokamensis]|uniref:Uncharacterized protein n=2 Tax=Deinococcus hohokamensis TaxID=309883 RepID=A0ABV9I6A0_9DEIO